MVKNRMTRLHRTWQKKVLCGVQALHIHMARLRLENEDDCVDDDGRGMTVMWHLPTSELHGVGGPWREKEDHTNTTNYPR